MRTVSKALCVAFIVMGSMNLQAQGFPNPQDIPAAQSISSKVIRLDLSGEVDKNQQPTVEVDVKKDIVYAHRDGMDLHLYVYIPKDTTDPLPCIVYVPGSAWMKQNLDMATPNLIRLAARGYVVANVEYRPSSVGKFPAQVQDAKSAIRFMRKNAATYHVDVDNVFGWGDSSGGHTSLFMGFTQNHPELDTDLYGEYSNKVNAVVNFFGPSELVRIPEFQTMKFPGASPEEQLIGANIAENQDLARKASPIYYATPDDAPVFMAHGDRDPLVPLHQSDLVAEALDKAGIPYEYYCVLGAGHGGREFWSDTMLDKIELFLKRYMVGER
ncbi:alpha/beta hydrolase [Parabacteroides sp. OttesenSCG-928-J18]|nr:alpha/beta hydrolase [Parabacteroides sp. OttesenSCG-928-J18]